MNLGLSFGRLSFVSLFLLVLVFKQINLNFLIPIWQTPDEQAHFAQVAYFSEFGSFPISGKDLNREIFESEKILGTLRDERGNNKYTYHPEFNIEYSDSNFGLYESDIQKLPKEFRKELVGQESANYPPLYYWLTATAYNVFYNANLIDRVYSTRIISLILAIGTIYLSWLIGKIVFPNKKIFQVTFSIMVAFHPMLAFVFTGVTSDNLLNFLFTGLLLTCLKIIQKGINKTYLLWLVFTFLLLYLTKPQFILAIPIIFITILLGFFLNTIFSKKGKISFVLFGLIVVLLLVLGSENLATYNFLEKIYPQSFFPGDSRNLISMGDFVSLTLNKTLRETIPWYWGVYKWLGLVYPIEVLRIINRVMILAGLGILIKIFFLIRNREKSDYIFLFLLLSSGIYFMGIVYYDYLKFSSFGFSFGLQGRYFFPMISAHMALLLIGLTSLIPKKFIKFETFLVKLIGLSIIILSIFAMWLIGDSYYDLSSLDTFIAQVSQYKPWLFKGYWVVFWLLSYLTTLVVFIFWYLRLKDIDKIK